MKKGVLCVSFVLMSLGLLAQAPQQFSYQVVVRDAGGNLLPGTTVGMKISILQGSATGTVVYAETHSTTTGAGGLASLAVGSGTVVSGTFATIDWPNGPYFIKTEIDPAGGTSYTVTSTSQLASVPYALYAGSSAGAQGPKGDTGPQGDPGLDGTDYPKYAVGDFAQGGIVFYVDETGHHGLVCAKTDQSAGVRWYAGTNGDTRAYGDGPFQGEQNTAIIIAAHVAIGDDGATYAARICNELQITEGGKTYGDWYLPSKEELNLMYQNKAAIDATATTNGGSAFASAGYWSSSEFDSFFAWLQAFYIGSQYGSINPKNSLNS
ncbi:MAG: hypothetical protein O2887_17065 [Bacteroidetes bacterium]|nr:hypothetical protein [Bacteroidota bacterium]MDA1122172.1 hypothetical protein [Bacteroidota bacterium]